ncbi:serine/threonine-protein kinase [Actinophytocola sp.]|uniref:serine/threonine-protein kinase n=1 Tax=Actinophytocola sp. TaxID=1872138 RepID=UPI003899DEEE
MQQQFDADEVASGLAADQVAYLGTGSFGETWMVKTEDGNRAIKIIYRPGYQVERLDREVASLRRVDHANVVRFYKVFLVAIGSGQYAAMEFEYIDGDSLTRAMSNAAISAVDLNGLARGLLNGLAALHGVDLIHRDLKPENITLRGNRFDSPVILDLGLAKLLDIESITRYPALIGSLLYMSPEQLRGERALKASDLWAVGTMLYEAATGYHPFFGDGERLTIDDALTRLQRPIAMPEKLPSGIADVIKRCLSQQAYKRGTVVRLIGLLNQQG